MDALIIPWILANPFTIMVALAVLKVIAKATPWAVDDEIVQILTGFKLPK